MTQPALWMNPDDGSVWTIFTSDSGISALKVLVDAGGNVSLQPMWQHATDKATNQTVANGVVYYANDGGQSPSPTGTLFALNASTGDVLWSAPITSHHWATPIVANGVLYNPDGKSKGRLTAYGLADQPASMLLEAESLKMASFTAGDVSHVAHDPNESGGHGVILEGKRPGDFVTLTVNVPRAGTYDVRVRTKNGINRGIWQLSIDGVKWGSVNQFCSWSVFPEVDLGNFTFTSAGDHPFTFAVTGKDPKSTGYWIALDYLELTTSTSLEEPSRSIRQGVYTQQQSEMGHQLYDHECASCHGTQLQGSQAGRAVVGDAFLQNWYGQRLSELMGRIQTTMPLGNAKLSPEQVAKVVAYLLERNGFPAGKGELASGPESAQQILIEPAVSKR
jgi:mono/diheme cytochrome c family protein